MNELMSRDVVELMVAASRTMKRFGATEVSYADDEKTEHCAPWKKYLRRAGVRLSFDVKNCRVHVVADADGNYGVLLVNTKQRLMSALYRCTLEDVESFLKTYLLSRVNNR